MSVLVADRLARSLTRPLSAVAAVAHRLAGGDLHARAAPTAGPPEVREVGGGLNLLADRIDALLSRERETAADLSHRLRTPLTALRIDTDSLRDPAELARIAADVDALERTVDEVIRAVRRPVHPGDLPMCDAVQVVAERLEFWSPRVGAVTVTIQVCGGALKTASASQSRSNWDRNTAAIPALNRLAVADYKTDFAAIHYSGATLTSKAYQASLRSAMTKAGI